MDLERKSLSLDGAQLKYDADVPGRFAGYASVFGGIDSYGDTIIPGAFKKSLKKRERPVMMRWNHYGPVIGKWMRIEEDEKGLLVEGELTLGHSVANDAHALMKHGAVTGLSIGYFPRKYTDTTLEDGTVVRELKEIELVEISIVEMPADMSAQIGDVKSALDAATTLKDIERLLRDAAGFSRADATALVSRIKSLARSECDVEAQQREASKSLAADLSAITSKLFKED